MNVYRSADDTWFVLLVTPDKLVGLAQASRPHRPPEGSALLRSGEADGEHAASHRHSG
jgi:hypothetical protein